MSFPPFRDRRRIPTIFFAVAIFLSSSLLFLLEFVAGKRLLPLLGGSGAVWAACLVFYQSALLLGYLTAHWLVTRASPRRQAWLYVALLALSLAQLATAITPTLDANSTRPVASVLWLLTLLIGLPFITLSATSPLLQAWYARTTAPLPGDEVTVPRSQPYGLFAISNVGSLMALVVYPWLLEPRWSLSEQTLAITMGFTVLAITCASVAFAARRAPPLPPTVVPEGEVVANDDGPRQRALWVALAACGSLLLSAITNHISQNVAALPLLWVIPLAAYLLSFVVAFTSERWQPRWLLMGIAVASLGGAAWLLYRGILSTPMIRATAIYCVSLFGLCWFLHSELYRRRPAPQRLTTFYFFVAAGGALGAIVVGIVAPYVLPGNYELAFGFFLVAALALIATWAFGWFVRGFWVGTVVIMIALIANQVRADRINVVARDRNFYGTVWVTSLHDSSARAVVRTLYHGVITHGREIFRQDLHAIPTTYYGHNSGIGFALDLCCGNRPRRVGVIGLGTGTLATYGTPGDVFRFYDINPAVEPLARRYFTFLRESKAKVEVVDGDARVSMAREAPQQYDVIAIDAFSGDAIPVHLITSEALEVYKRQLRPNGVVVFHVSNRYLNLPPVVEQIARHAGMHTAFISSPDESIHDVWTSDWVIVTADSALIANPQVKAATDSITVPPRLRRWTDDYNSLIPILRTHR